MEFHDETQLPAVPNKVLMSEMIANHLILLMANLSSGVKVAFCSPAGDSGVKETFYFGCSLITLQCDAKQGGFANFDMQ